MEWAMVLVIILSVFLAIFLLLAIVLTVMLIKISRQIKSVTASAERTALKFENAATNIATYSSPVALVKLFSSVFKRSNK